MDKTEYNIKLEQIHELVEKQDVQGASEIADTIDWKRVKSIRTLCMVADIYEANKRIEESKQILLMAYNRSSVGKAILYRLVEVSIKLDQLDDAVDYYTEYAKIARGDNSKYILKYKIYRARRAPLKEQIAILEEYRAKEYTERWAYELARLYDRADLRDKCIEVCDDLILWFSEGKYVIKAMELKMKYTPLSPSQQEKYSKRERLATEPGYVTSAPAGQMPLAGGELPQMKVQPRVPVQEFPVLQGMSGQAGDDAAAEAAVTTDMSMAGKPIYADPPRVNSENLQEKLAMSFRDVLSGLNKVKNEVTYTLGKWDDIKDEAEEESEDINDYEVVRDLEPEQLDKLSQRSEPQLTKVVERALTSETAEKEQPSAEVYIDMSPVEEVLAAESEAEIPEEAILEAETPEEAISEAETTEETISEAEMPEEAISEAEIPEEEIADEDLPIEKTPEERLSEEAAENISKILEQAAKTLTEQAEREKDNQQEPVVEEPQIQASAQEESAVQEEVPQESEIQEGILLETEDFVEESEEEVLPEMSWLNQEDTQEFDLEEELREALKVEEEEEEDPSDGLNEYFGITNKEVAAEKVSEDETSGQKELSIEEQVLREETTDEKRVRILNDSKPESLSDEQKKLFSYFAKVPGMDRQLLDALYGVYRYAGEKTSKHGNIAVMGSKGTGKSKLSAQLVKAICKDLGLEAVKYACISGEEMNKKDPVKVVARLSGGFLLIDRAGAMTDETVGKLSRALEFRTDSMVMMLEDEKDKMRKLLADHPEFSKKIETVISIPVFTNDELVSFARIYAKEMGYRMDEMGVLALYTRIGDNQTEREPITVAKVKEMVDGAIANTQKVTRKFGRKLAVNSTDEEGCVILYEKDFH